MTEPIATPTLPYAVQPRELVCEKTENGLRIYIPFRVREKLILVAWVVSLMIFSAGLFTFASVILVGFRAGFFLILGSCYFALFIAFILILLLLKGVIFEYDGSVLRSYTYGSSRTVEWPRSKIRKVSATHFPLLPVANVLIQVGYDEVRVGFGHPKQLAEAVSQLQEAMGLNAKQVAASKTE